jgi:hypothetical protein
MESGPGMEMNSGTEEPSMNDMEEPGMEESGMDSM